jgi:hypothetical protein
MLAFSSNCCILDTQNRMCRMRLKCNGTRAETRFCLLAKRTSPFKSAGTSVQSTTSSRGVRISGSNAGYTMFHGSVKSTGHPLHSLVSPLLPPPRRHRVPSHFNWTLPAFINVQFDFLLQGKNRDWRCLRTGLWKDYLYVTGKHRRGTVNTA